MEMAEAQIPPPELPLLAFFRLQQSSHWPYPGEAPFAAAANGASAAPFVVAQAPKEFGKIEMYSPVFYAACTAGGMASCGITHAAVTPLDLVKCSMQIDPAKYKSISSGFGVLLKEQGARGFFRGWVPTLLGYSAQGACRFGFYEFFKKYYSYTMMKFASFQTVVEMIYKYAIPAPKDQCSKPEFCWWIYRWNILCCSVSHPADNLVSFLNNAKGATVGDAVQKLGLWGGSIQWLIKEKF